MNLNLRLQYPLAYSKQLAIAMLCCVYVLARNVTSLVLFALAIKLVIPTSKNIPIYQLKILPTKHKKIYQFSGIWYVNIPDGYYQRWSPRGRPWPRGRPRGHILKSLALASKVKSLALASRPQVLENWPVLGSRTAVFFELLKFCEALENFFGKRFFVKNF